MATHPCPSDKCKGKTLVIVIVPKNLSDQCGIKPLFNYPSSYGCCREEHLLCALLIISRPLIISFLQWSLMKIWFPFGAWICHLCDSDLYQRSLMTEIGRSSKLQFIFLVIFFKSLFKILSQVNYFKKAVAAWSEMALSWCLTFSSLEYYIYLLNFFVIFWQWIKTNSFT